MFSYFNISPFLLFSQLFYFLESQFRNLLHPFRSRLLVFPSYYSAIVLFIDLWIDPPPLTLLSFFPLPPPFVFHAFPFAPILVSSSFTAKSRRYSPSPLVLASRDGFFLPSPVGENFYPPIDGPRPEFSWKWREQADFRVARAAISFSGSRLNTNLVRVCQGKHVYRSRGRFH